MNYIREYWEKIQSGEIVVGWKIRRTYEILIDMMDNPRDPWVFDEALGEYPIEFIERFCKHSKGKWAGKPVILDLWQKAQTQAVYGFVHKETRLRKFKESFTVVARKNGKSTKKSADGLYMLVGDQEPGFEGYTAATKKDQARIVFTEMANMVAQSRELSAIITKRKSDLYFGHALSTFKPLASDSNSLDGLNSAYIVIDELHGIKDRNLYDVLKQSMSAREQPLLDIITTAGYNREGIYDNLYDYAEKVLKGEIIDEEFISFIYELDNRDEWTDPEMWQKANPGLGSMKTESYIAANVERAKVDPDFLPTVLTKDFNIRETIAKVWLSYDDINNPSTFDLEDFRDCYAIAGTDISSVGDLTCSTVLLMKPDDPVKYIHQMYWIPEDILDKKVKEDKIPYDKWYRQGWIQTTPGNTVKPSQIREWHLEVLNTHGVYVYWHGYDEWNAAYFVEDMEAHGFKMYRVRQGAKTMSGPMKQLKADLSAKLVNYNNNPVLKWCLSNMAIDTDPNGNIRPIKGRTHKQRIDGAVSLIDAYVVFVENMADFLNLI